MASILDEWNPALEESVTRVQHAIVQTVLPMKGDNHPLVIAIALIRAARVLLRLAPKNDRKRLVPVLCAYLHGSTKPPADEPKSELLYLPKKH